MTQTKKNNNISLLDYKDSYFDQLETLLKASGIYDSTIDTKEIISKKITFDPGSIILAFEDSRLVGTVYTIFDPWKSFIYHLGIEPSMQKKGVGSILLAEAEKRLYTKGCHQIILFIKQENSHVRCFYEKRGWQAGNNRILMQKYNTTDQKLYK
jgi:GNAT superfamily N-acetyltransferase